jgi:hypothetical protein
LRNVNAVLVDTCPDRYLCQRIPETEESLRLSAFGNATRAARIFLLYDLQFLSYPLYGLNDVVELL